VVFTCHFSTPQRTRHTKVWSGIVYLEIFHETAAAFAAGWMRPDRRVRSISTHRMRFLEPALSVAFVLLMARSVAKDSPSVVSLKARRAQEFVDQLRVDLPIRNGIQIAVVAYDPLVFSVRPTDTDKDRFLMTMELGFLLMLKDDELRAAVAHELGHVWIYTHRPFLQTEQLANSIGQRVVGRESFEKMYAKLWMYEGASGVPIDDLLGRSPAGIRP